ncbi:MAG: insulinase family protein [Betaproteobacteria bacterium]|nr:insulinase family protein [Betaproteobacteria bacterium]NBY13319.1 insulinase family protein [Betaproteobacteria bacterium]
MDTLAPFPRLRFPWLCSVSIALLLLAPLGLHAESQKIETWRSSAGVSVLFIAAPDIPMMDLAIDIDAGSRWDPPGLEGLASITTDLSGRGLKATERQPSLSENELERALGELAIQRSSSVTPDRTSLRYRFLIDRPVRQRAALLAGRQLAHPLFQPETFERERARNQSTLRESLTRPQTLAVRALWASMYPDHPYGRQETESSLAAIGIEQIRAFHQRNWRPERMQISIVGALTLDEARAFVEDLLEPMSRESAGPAAQASALTAEWPFMISPIRTPLASTQTLAHPASQSHIWLGLPVLARSELEDYFPMLVANHILGGGGFTSRLTREVREKRGLSYSVFSALAPRAQSGPLLIGLQTQREKSAQALQVVRRTLEEFLAKGPTEDELVAAKKNLMGGFALRLDTNRKLLDTLSEIGFYRLPLNYLDQWTEAVAAVSAEDIQRVLQKRVTLERLSTVVVAGAAR